MNFTNFGSTRLRIIVENESRKQTEIHLEKKEKLTLLIFDHGDFRSLSTVDLTKENIYLGRKREKDFNQFRSRSVYRSLSRIVLDMEKIHRETEANHTHFDRRDGSDHYQRLL